MRTKGRHGWKMKSRCDGWVEVTIRMSDGDRRCLGRAAGAGSGPLRREIRLEGPMSRRARVPTVRRLRVVKPQSH